MTGGGTGLGAGASSLTDGELREIATRKAAGETWAQIDAALGRTCKDAWLRAGKNGARERALGGEGETIAPPPAPVEAPARPVPVVQRMTVASATRPAPTADLVSHSQSAHTIRIRARRTPQWEQWILLTADHHWDHPDCDRDLLAYHLDLAADRGAGAMVFGDLYCAMQSRDDRRGGKSSIRPEHQTAHYLDALINTGVDWYAPWADRLWLVSDGNHETAVHKRLETDLVARLCEGLQRQHKSPVMRGSYRGFCTLLLDDGQTVQPIKLFWDHGSGGGGIVTKGVIQTNRRAAYVDADIVVTGHVHERWVLELSRQGVTDDGTPYKARQTHVCCSTYKDEGISGNGWHVETGKPPKPLGGWWLRLTWSQRIGRVQWQLMEVES